jgi:hypothetical protein
MSLYSIHLRPWLLAAEALRPSRSIISSATADKEKIMNVLGVSISLDPAPGRRVWAKRAAALAAANALVLMGGAAYAFWSVSGSGSGAASGGTSTPLTIVAGTPGSLVPGGTANVTLTITNNNKANVSLSALSFTTAGVAGYTDATYTTVKGACSAANSATGWATAGKSLTPIVIAANGGSYTLTLTGAATMGVASDDACQGAFFKLDIPSVTAAITASVATSPTSGTQ